MDDGNSETTRPESDREDREVEPQELNPEFELGDISPPVVVQPLYACAEIVRLRGLLKGATVTVLVDGREVARTQAEDGDIAVEVNPLAVGQRVTAVQEFERKPSDESFPAALVLDHPRTLPRPRVKEPVFDCSDYIAVDNAFVGARLHVAIDRREVSSLLVTKRTQRVALPQTLKRGQRVAITQTYCEDADRERVVVEGVNSPSVVAAPSPMPRARIDENSITIGNDRLVVRDLLVGARQILTEQQSRTQGTYRSPHEDVWMILNRRIEQGDSYSLVQELCVAGPPSDTVDVTDDPAFKTLDAPVVVAPLCPGDRVVRVRDTLSGAVVCVVVDGALVACATAAGHETSVALPGGMQLRNRQDVTALQYIGNTVSPMSSPPVTVQGTNGVIVEVLGIGVHQSDDRVPVRGIYDRDANPIHVRVTSCCDREAERPATMRIISRNGDTFGPFPMANLGSGKYEGHAFAPEDTAFGPGEYYVVVEGLCDGKVGEAYFDVLLSEPQRNDPTEPLLNMEVVTPDGLRWTLTGTNSNPFTANAFIGDRILVEIRARDTGGLRRVGARITGTVAQAGLATAAASGNAPVPIELGTRGSIVPRDVGTVTMEAVAANFSAFNMVSRTPQFVLSIEQRQPILATIDPTRSEHPAKIDLTGQYLQIPNGDTYVVFRRMGTVVNRVQVTGPFTDTSITGLDVPSGLAPGFYDVAVEVGTNGVSNALSFEVVQGAPAMPPEKIHMQVLNFQRRNVGGNIVFLRAVGTLDFGYGYSSWWIKSTRNPNSGNAATLRVMSPQGTEATIGPLQTVTDFEDENVIGWWALVPTSANSSAWNRSEIPLVFTLTDRKP